MSQTTWSEWEWNQAGYWEACRTNARGEVEWRRDPPQQLNSTPRTYYPPTQYTSGDQVPDHVEEFNRDPSGRYYNSSTNPSSSWQAGTSAPYSGSSTEPILDHGVESNYVTNAPGSYYTPGNTLTSSPYYASGATNLYSSAGSAVQAGDSSRRNPGYDYYANPAYNSSSYVPGPSTSFAPPQGGYYSNAPPGPGYAGSSSAPHDTLSDDMRRLNVNNSTIDTIPEDRVSIPQKRIQREKNSSDVEKLDPRYRVVLPKDSKGFWKFGRTFAMLWSEPAGEKLGPRGGTRNSSHISTVWLNGTVMSEIRRFVLVKDGHGSCQCLAIHTYSDRATLKRNLPDPDNHAIIYTSEECPEEHYDFDDNNDLRYEELVLDPIQVEPHNKRDSLCVLSPLSRINYTKVYTVEKDVRVFNIGMVKNTPSLEVSSPLKSSEGVPRKARRHSSSSKDSKKPDPRSQSRTSSSRTSDSERKRRQG